MLQDIRFAARTLIKSPGFTLAAVLCLGLGIGVNTTIFSCVQAVLLRPFPYKDPERLMAVGENNIKRGWDFNSVSYPNFRSWQEQNRTFESMGAYTGNSFNLSTEDAAEYVQGGAVSWTMFHVLGVRPALGRDFREEEDAVGAPKVVILSDRLWREKFSARRDILGTEVRLNGTPHTVIGVMPPDFEFPGLSKAWVTLSMDPLRNRGNHSWAVMGRLKNGVTVEQARRDLNTIAKELEAKYPESNTGWGAAVEDLRDQMVGDVKPVMAIMMAAVGFVLLIACANVANLLLARAASRSKEMAVRSALGASRWRVVKQLLTESLLIALAGASLGVAFGYGFLQWVKASIPQGNIPFWMKFEIDQTVLGYTALVAVATGFLFGLVPAIQASRPDLNSTLRESGSRGSSAGRARQRVRSALVVVEVALSLILLVGATLLIRSFLGMSSVQPGFDTSNLLTLRLSLNGPAYDSTHKRQAFLERLMPRLSALPGVAAAATINTLPLSNSNNNSSITVEGRPTELGQEPVLSIRWVSPDYLDAMKMPLTRGRMFTDQEWRDSTVNGRVAVINEYMAETMWPKEDPIGKRFKFGNATDTLNRWFTVVGVVPDVKHQRLNQKPDLQGYAPYRQGGWSGMSIVVRTRGGDPIQATGPVLRALKEVDPMLPAFRIMTMEANVERSYWQQRLYGRIFGVFAVIALALAAVGVYGVISYGVTQRTQEIGVRVALGAQRNDVLRLIVGHGLVLGAIGSAIGLLGAVGATKALTSMLYGIGPWDPVTFASITALLLAVAVLASLIPAARAAKVDPVEALRIE
jgi:putative ABC transport system permease protein